MHVKKLDKWVGVRMTSAMYYKLDKLAKQDETSIPDIIRKTMRRVINVAFGENIR